MYANLDGGFWQVELRGEFAPPWSRHVVLFEKLLL